MSSKSIIKSTDGKTLCPHCRSEVDPKASRCPKCQGKIYQWTLGKKLLVGLILLIAVPTIINIGSGSSSSSSSSASTSQPSDRVSQGQNGYVRISGSDSVAVLRTKELMDEYVKAAVNKDTYGMAQLLLGGGGFFVSNDTKVLVIDSSIGARQIRILEGKFVGQSGWVPMEFVHSQPATSGATGPN